MLCRAIAFGKLACVESGGQRDGDLCKPSRADDPLPFSRLGHPFPSGAGRAPVPVRPWAGIVMDDGSLVTPPLSGTILPGITRDAIITLARKEGRTVREERYANAISSGARQAEPVCRQGPSRRPWPIGRPASPRQEGQARARHPPRRAVLLPHRPRPWAFQKYRHGDREARCRGMTVTLLSGR